MTFISLSFGAGSEACQIAASIHPQVFEVKQYFHSDVDSPASRFFVRDRKLESLRSPVAVE